MTVDHEKLVARVQHFYEHLQNRYHYESERALQSSSSMEIGKESELPVKIIEEFIDEYEDIFSDCIYFG
jgi:hypothetical protein